MLKIKFLFFAALILSCSMFAQNLWTSEVPINFTIQANTKVASFVDANGVHIVYSRNGGIRYALANSQGSVIKYDKVIEAEGSGTNFANVAAIGNSVYAVYYKNNFIQVSRSTNLGDNWSNSFSNRPMTNTGCSKIVAYSDGENIHITWAELRVGSTYYQDAHYIKFKPSTVPLPTWSDYKNVSDLNTEGGQNPDLALSTGKVHVNFTSFNQPKDRDRISSGSWNNPEDIPYNQYPMVNSVKNLKPIVVGNQLNVLYKSAWSGMDYSGIFLSHSYKSVDGSTWTQNQSTLETDYIDIYTPYPHVAANTIDGKIHFIYWDKNQAKYSYRTLIGSSFSNHIAEIPISSLSTSLNGNANDLYLIQTRNNDVPGSIYFRHYNAAPLAPINPQLSSNPGNGMVRFSWTKNNEPDISLYEVWRKVHETGDIWQSIGTTTNTYFVDPNYWYAPGVGNFLLTYKVRAKDIGNNYSLYCSEVSTRGEELGKQLFVENSQLDFRLQQNHPNPFNPSTKISYSIKEEGLVTLKIYDILGKEIATLVNENKPIGNYEVDFNASQLPSGMYIYKIQTGIFNDAKKMLLTK